MMEMKEYKVVVKNNEEAEEVRNLFELLGYKKESFHFNCYYPRSVVTQYRYEWLSTGHACDCENGEELTIQQLRDLVAQKQCLISGADALRALADGKEVEYWCDSDPSIQKRWTPIKALSDYKLSYFLENKPRFEFRLAPRTITINGIEIPAPFEPKVGDTAYFLSTSNACGYSYTNDFKGYGFDSLIQFGAWRTEEEIKQVVAALRGALKNG